MSHKARRTDGRLTGLLALVVVLASALPCAAGADELVALPPSWPDAVASYRIEARLDTAEHRVTGRERITWRNTSSQSVPDLQLHLYQNAYKNDQTDFLREHLRDSPGYLDDLKGAWGWIDVTSMRLGTGEDLTGSIEFVTPDDDNEYDQTVARVALPRPVPPGGSVDVDVEFVNQLVPTVDRSGYHDTFYFVAQWFPKVGVYEDRGVRGRSEPGWNCHQFHANSEFYADFGTYDVSITVPEGYVFGSTGVAGAPVSNADGTVTIGVVQEHVHDFVWTVDPEYVVVEEQFRWRDRVSSEELERAARVAGITPEEASLRDVTVRLLVHREHLGLARRHLEATHVSLKHLGLRYGAYPYDAITVVDPSYGGRGVGGMEYPMLITAGVSYLEPERDYYGLESLVVHEFGHQFWYGMVASNEFEEAWLDEGINSYTEGSILEEAYGPSSLYTRVLDVPVPGASILDVVLPLGLGEIPLGPYPSYIPYSNWRRSRASYLRSLPPDPIVRAAWEFRDSRSYNTNSYHKPEVMLHALEQYLGRDRFTRALRTYQMRWRFRHPSTADFVATFDEAAGEDLSWFFDQFLYGTGRLDYAVGSVSSETPDRSGVFDGPNGRTTLTDEEESEEPGAVVTRVVVERRGEVVVPVEVRARFVDGSEQLAGWDGRDAWHELRFESAAKVAAVEVDPFGRYASLDSDLENNGRRMKPDRVAVDRWSVSSLYWFQTMLAELSGVS